MVSGMFSVSEAEAAAICDAYEQDSELAAAVTSRASPTTATLRDRRGAGPGSHQGRTSEPPVASPPE